MGNLSKPNTADDPKIYAESKSETCVCVCALYSCITTSIDPMNEFEGERDEEDTQQASSSTPRKIMIMRIYNNERESHKQATTTTTFILKYQAQSCAIWGSFVRKESRGMIELTTNCLKHLHSLNLWL